MVKYHNDRHGGRIVIVLLLRYRKHTHGNRLFYHTRHSNSLDQSNEACGIKIYAIAPKVESLVSSVLADLVGVDRVINQVKWSQSQPVGPDRKTSVGSRHQSQCIITHGTS